jgi:membrane-associated phospholipid phosphatase
LFRWVNDLARDTPWLHGTARLYANQGVVLFGVLLVVGALWARRHSLLLLVRAVLAGVGVLVAVAVNQPIVAAVAAPRPFVVYPHALVLVHRSTDPSFPSDHATMAGAVAVGLLFVNRRLGVLAAALAVLMAMARVYVGAHFPLDVVAGLIVGGAVAAIVQLPAPRIAASSFTRRLPDTWVTGRSRRLAS